MNDSAPQHASRIGRRLKLRDLQILAAVVQWGSMAKAASHLAMSQPAVSESVANLEGVLGVLLLDRNPRGIEPTLYANALLKRSHVVFDELNQALGDIEFLSNPTVGEVRIAAGDTFAAGLLPEAISQLSRRHPNIVVRVVQSNAQTQDFREVRDRTVDMALARTSRSFSDEDLDVEILFDDRHRVVAGAASAWARRRNLTLDELVDESWIFASNRVIRELIGEAFKARGLQMPQERVSANSILLRNHLLATGRFLTVLPESALRHHAQQWALKVLPIDLDVEPRAVAIVTLKNRTLSPVVQLFADHVRGIARTMFASAKRPRAA
jgi:DNA-binding transcriptional LysR family regulator